MGILAKTAQATQSAFNFMLFQHQIRVYFYLYKGVQVGAGGPSSIAIQYFRLFQEAVTLPEFQLAFDGISYFLRARSKCY